MEILLKMISGNGNTNSLLAHYIAAILNATSSPMSYGSTVNDIQTGLCKAIADGKMVEFKDILDDLNNRGCFLNAKGECADGYVFHEAACIPAGMVPVSP